MNYSIGTASKKEFDFIIDWAANEGWNPGIYDKDAFYSTDPNGFILGFLEDQPIASISAVKYGEKFGFMGFYIVKKEFRGKGYGLKIWNYAINYLKNRNIGLDGVVSQQENYKKLGFKLAYRNIRYEGKSNQNNNKNKQTVHIKNIPIKKLIDYDNTFFPEKRSDFLNEFISQPDSYGAAFVESKDLKGYGIIRKCRVGYKIGPLFAESEKIAQIIFEDLTGFLDQGTEFYFDVPEINNNSVKLAENAGMRPMFETARMYNKFVPDLPVSKIFGVTTFELG